MIPKPKKRKKKKKAVEFTPEVRRAVFQKQRGRCIECNANLEKCWPPASLHHKKKRGALTTEEIEKHGPGGGEINAIWACGKCHERIEANDPDFAKYRTSFWQDVGETQEEVKEQ